MKYLRYFFQSRTTLLYGVVCATALMLISWLGWGAYTSFYGVYTDEAKHALAKTYSLRGTTKPYIRDYAILGSKTNLSIVSELGRMSVPNEVEVVRIRHLHADDPFSPDELSLDLIGADGTVHERTVKPTSTLMPSKTLDKKSVVPALYCGDQRIEVPNGLREISIKHAPGRGLSLILQAESYEWSLYSSRIGTVRGSIANLGIQGELSKALARGPFGWRASSCVKSQAANLLSRSDEQLTCDSIEANLDGRFHLEEAARRALLMAGLWVQGEEVLRLRWSAGLVYTLKLKEERAYLSLGFDQSGHECWYSSYQPKSAQNLPIAIRVAASLIPQ